MAVSSNEEVLLAIGPIVIAMVAMMVIYATRFKRVPPNKAMVVFGKKQKRTKSGYMIITGGAKFIQPILEEIAFLSLEALPLNVEMKDVRVDTRNTNARVALRANSVVRISNDPKIMDNAAKNLLGKSEIEIKEISINIVEGHVRNACAHTPLEEVRNNFPQVSSMILSTTNIDLNKVGLEMVSFSIVDVQ